MQTFLSLIRCWKSTFQLHLNPSGMDYIYYRFQRCA